MLFIAVFIDRFLQKTLSSDTTSIMLRWPRLLQEKETATGGGGADSANQHQPTTEWFCHRSKVSKGSRVNWMNCPSSKVLKMLPSWHHFPLHNFLSTCHALPGEARTKTTTSGAWYIPLRKKIHWVIGVDPGKHAGNENKSEYGIDWPSGGAAPGFLRRFQGGSLTKEDFYAVQMIKVIWPSPLSGSPTLTRPWIGCQKILAQSLFGAFSHIFWGLRIHW